MVHERRSKAAGGQATGRYRLRRSGSWGAKGKRDGAKTLLGFGELPTRREHDSLKGTGRPSIRSPADGSVPGFGEAMIESIQFSNYKALRKTTLPLQPFTLLLGPNGSGKNVGPPSPPGRLPTGRPSKASRGELVHGVERDRPGPNGRGGSRPAPTIDGQNHPCRVSVASGRRPGDYPYLYETGAKVGEQDAAFAANWLGQMQTYALDASAIARPSP